MLQHICFRLNRLLCMHKQAFVFVGCLSSVSIFAARVLQVFIVLISNLFDVHFDLVKVFPVHDTFAFVSLEDTAMTQSCVKKHTIDAKLFMNRQWRLRELRLRSKSCLVPLPQIQSSETEIAELSGSIADLRLD